jgi:hypothetical protein
MINWNEASTKRGMIWVIAFIVGIIGWWMGKDPSPILLIAAGVAGGLGVTTPDKPE